MSRTAGNHAVLRVAQFGNASHRVVRVARHGGERLRLSADEVARLVEVRREVVRLELARDQDQHVREAQDVLRQRLLLLRFEPDVRIRGRGMAAVADAPSSNRRIVSWLKLEYVVSPPMNPIVTAERTVGDQPSVSAACIRAAITKQPTRLTISVPYGKALPRRCAAQTAIR